MARRSRPAGPYTLLTVTAVICAVPPLLNLLGVDFGTQPARLDIDGWAAQSAEGRESAYFRLTQGPIVHTLLEWSGVCVATITALVSFVHYFLKRDITTPVIGTALLFIGLFDGFRILAFDRLLVPIRDPLVFVPLTWAVSRNFHIVILIIGTLPFLFGDARAMTVRRDIRDYAVFFLLFAGSALAAIVYFCNLGEPASDEGPTGLTSLTLNFTAMTLYAIGGTSVLIRYQRKYPSLFARSLQASVVPHVCAQLYAAFGTELFYDNGFHLASAYKLFGYFVPLVGLMLDYRRASLADTELRTTERQLQIARQISESLLPDTPPAIDGWEVAGFSRASEAVGGDYFDYITLPNESVLVVIADVSGHDLGAALLTADARSYLKALAETQGELNHLTSRLNDLVGRSARQRRFITAFFARLTPGEGGIEYVDAGHTGYIVEPDGQHRTLSQQNIPLGIADSINEPPAQTKLGPGESLVLVTDGIVETLSPDGQQFGMQRLADAIAAGQSEPVATIIARVRDTVGEWADGASPSDDQTLVIIRQR